MMLSLMCGVLVVEYDSCCFFVDLCMGGDTDVELQLLRLHRSLTSNMFRPMDKLFDWKHNKQK